MESAALSGMFVYLDIVADFACQQCGVCCNNDWLVTVDEPGYQRNRQLFEQSGRQDEFAQAFIPLGSGAELGEYARIAKRPSGGCWFLTAEKLCRLQQVAGHQHLDSVCQWFPRYPMDTERGIELSLSFSCPAAVKLALRQEPLRIVRAGVSPIPFLPVEFVRHVYPGQQPADSILRYYFEIEGHLIDLLQARQLSLPERLELVQRSLRQIDTWQDPAGFGQRLNQLFQANYTELDTSSTHPDLVQETPASWLAENYFVNFLFRKNLYVKGIADGLKQIDRMAQIILPGIEQSAVANDTAELEQLIVVQELTWNHNSRSRQVEGSAR
jgi:lysine-N-methylase